MGLVQDAESWAFNIAAKKVIIKGCTILTAWILSGFLAPHLANAGVTVDQIKFQAYLTAGALMALKAVEDWVNLKYGTNI